MLWQDCLLFLLIANIIGARCQMVQVAHAQSDNEIFSLATHLYIFWQVVLNQLSDSGLWQLIVAIYVLIRLKAESIVLIRLVIFTHN